MKKDKVASPEKIIVNGWRLVDEALTTFEHLIGPSPKSLALVPLLYFYNDGGRHVRSLLYGLIYWLFSGGNEGDVLARKRVFSAHRAAFEQMLLTDKENIIRRIGRNIGSGPEVTYPTARFYQGLFELLARHNDNIRSEQFEKDYKELVDKLKIPDKSAGVSQISEGKGRIFTEKQKSTVVLRSLFSTATRCGICEGILDPRGGLQHDHTLKWSEGGPTIVENDRLTHPFCNNNRDIIEALRKGQQTLKLPAFFDPDLFIGTKQLRLFDMDNFDPYADIDV